MSATYNWAYKPGVGNKYGINITASADNVAPSNAVYVALFGNDITGNGSREYPYRTITFVSNNFNGRSVYVIVGAGVYRGELMSDAGSTNILVGDGDVFIDNSIIGNSGSVLLINIKFSSSAQLTTLNSFDSIIATSNPSNQNVIRGDSLIQGSLIYNIPTFSIFGINSLQVGNRGTYTGGFVNGYNTYSNIPDLTLTTGGFSVNKYINHGYFSIFNSCNISITGDLNLDYSVFCNCQFRTGITGSYTTINDLPTFLNFITAAYPFNNSYQHCVFTSDVKFNNSSIGDYTLNFASPAKNTSYFGTPSGAYSIGYGIKASSATTISGFDASSVNNLTIENDSITLIDTTQIASVESKVIPNIIQREIRSLPTFGFNADRNGEYVDSIIDLSTSAITASQSLTTPTPYLVNNGAIVYNGQTYQPGDRFTTITGITAFTTTASGITFEILEAPERHTVMARFSNGNGIVTSGTSLNIGYWYYVDSGAVTYSGNTYSGGTVFKALNTSGFTGSGVVEAVMTGQTYQHYEINNKPYSNNVGNLRLGDIIRGNGDPNYVRGGVNVTEFPINAKFIQLKYIIQVANLTP